MNFTDHKSVQDDIQQQICRKDVVSPAFCNSKRQGSEYKETKTTNSISKKKKKVKGYIIHNRALFSELSLIKINEKCIFKLHVAQIPCSSATNKKQNTKL